MTAVAAAERRWPVWEVHMRDLLFPAVVVAFFLLAAGYVRACSAIAAVDEPDRASVEDVPDTAAREARS
jgi:hypothetical protein